MVTKSRISEGSISLPYRWAMGPTITRFFEEFKNKKIMATRCSKCNRVLVPARSFCPRCYEDMTEWVQVSDTGTVRSWVLVNYDWSNRVIPIPSVVAMIALDGADVLFIHLVGGIDLSNLDKVADQVKMGMRVRAKWRDERKGNMLDIEYFEPTK